MAQARKVLLFAVLVLALTSLPVTAWSRSHIRGKGNGNANANANGNANAKGSDKDKGKDKGKDKDGDKGQGSGQNNSSQGGNSSGNSSSNGNGSGNKDKDKGKGKNKSGSGSNDSGSNGSSETQQASTPPPAFGQEQGDDLLAPATPAFSTTVAAQAVLGTVLVKTPDSAHFVPLTDVNVLPSGSLVDASAGSVRIVSPLSTGAGVGGTGGTGGDPNGPNGPNGANGRQQAVFSGAVFEVVQNRAAKPITDIVLRGGDFSGCGVRARSAKRAHAAGKRVARRVWAGGKGRFRTRGRYGSATVRGTVWMTEDRCDGTLVSVAHGLVEVRDFVRNKTVLVPAGRSYLARASG